MLVCRPYIILLRWNIVKELIIQTEMWKNGPQDNGERSVVLKYRLLYLCMKRVNLVKLFKGDEGWRRKKKDTAVAIISRYGFQKTKISAETLFGGGKEEGRLSGKGVIT